jgi:phosphoribosyl 1,2-cyclic phosphodiesterase
MKFRIIGTGSTGNCFLIDNSIMIDCGLPYAQIKSYMPEVRYVLLTHIHGDHLKLETVRNIAVYHEDVVFFCGSWLAQRLSIILDSKNLKVFEFGDIFEFEGYKISPVELYHDVPNCGYRIMKDGFRHLHITDTVSLDGIEAKGYDSASIECNHEINAVNKIIEQARMDNVFTHLIGAVNSHLAVHKTIEFCIENGIKTLYPVHIGSSTKIEVIAALRAASDVYLQHSYARNTPITH